MLLFRLPNEAEIYTLNTSERKDFSVVFFDFHQKEKYRFEGKKTLATTQDYEKIQKKFLQNSPLKEITPNDTKETYTKKIRDIQNFLEKENLPKLVLSRRKYNLFSEKKIDISQSFKQMCHTYPSAFVYAFVKDNTAWLGGFYEVLGKINNTNGIFQTMSLAGTLPIDEEWTEKEFREQNSVTEYITETLQKFSNKIEKGALQDAFSGNIKHLFTPFLVEIAPKNFHLLIKALHPTPAVCGIPKEICTSHIQNLESEPRDLYSGYIEISNEHSQTCFVNLRCARLYPNAVKIYIGGGINTQSLPEKEWQETELKAQAIENNLRFEEI